MPIRTWFEALLAWYGPQGWWPGDSPFEIMAGAVLVQRTTWRQAARALDRLRCAGGLSPSGLKGISPAEIETHLRPAGFYKQKAQRLLDLASFIEEQGGIGALGRWTTADLRQRLLNLTGIGPETADAMLLYAFGRPVFVVDAYARRLFGRLGHASRDDTALKLRVESQLPETWQLNEFHALIVIHGQRYCRSVPACESCPLQLQCSFRRIRPERVFDNRTGPR